MEHNPTIATLLVLTRKLKLRFAFAVGPPRQLLTVHPRKTEFVERVEDDKGPLMAAAG